MSNLTPQVQNEFKNQLNIFKSEVSKLLPSHISTEKFERVVYSAALRNPDLITIVERKSFFDACIQAATFGVIPDGKKCTILPYGNKAQFTPMIGGIIEKLYNSGDVSSIISNVVYEKDKFKRWVDDDGEHILHEPEDFDDGGKQVGVYALVKTKEGRFSEFMNMKQINAVRAMAKSKNVWDGSFGTEMHKKAVFRRLSKRLNLSEESERFIRSDDDMIDLNAVAVETKAEQMKKIISVSNSSIAPVNETEKQKEAEPVQEKEAPQGEFENFTTGGFKK